MERGRYKLFCPKVRDDGVTVVGGSTEKWMEMSYKLIKSEVPLLSYKHDFSRLYSKHIHQLGHHGVNYDKQGQDTILDSRLAQNGEIDHG